MGWAVLAHADRVVGKNVNIGELCECAEPNSSAAIIGKHQEGRTRSAEQPMVRNAVKNRAHAVLANAETDVASPEIIAIEIAAVLDVIHGRTVQVGTAPDQ